MTALDHHCEVCSAKPGENCRNTIKPGTPLPGRATHYARSLELTSKDKEGVNESIC